MRRLFLLILLLLLPAGCGYHVPGRSSSLPPDVRTVTVRFFANRTLEPLVENAVTVAIAERFARGRLLRVVDGDADAVFTGQVSAYTSEPVAYDRGDEISSWRSSLTVSAVLQRPTGEVLWRGGISWYEDYPASDDKARQEDNEAAAIRTASERIAEELYYRLTEDF